MVDDGRRTDGRTTEHGYTISSPCEPDGSGELKNPFSAFNIVFKALTSRLKQKQSATKIANLADFRSRKISANVTVFGFSKILTFLEGVGVGWGAAANFLVICALTCRIQVIFCSKCESLHRMQSAHNTSSNAL